VLDRARFEPLDPASPLTAEGVGTYRGAIEVRPTGGSLAVVDDVGLEDYVRGIAEMPPTWPLAAQEAQAIAARTYALYTMRQQAATDWRAAGAQICDSQDCQVYRGVAKEQQDGAAGWLEAVRITQGYVMLWQGQPINAKYSSSNGGWSVPGGQPYLRSIPDPDDALSPLHHWRYAIPFDAMAQLFQVPGQLFNVGRAGDSVVMTSLLPDGTQAQQSMSYLDFRAKLNASLPPPNGLPVAVPSDRFDVGFDGDGVVIDGRGWGHGIGMSQYGALGKAMRGWNAPQILAAYYGGVPPVQLDPASLPATIRVAVALGRSTAAVAGAARVVDGSGRLVATGTGSWSVTPAGHGTVRVRPPAGWAPLPEPGGAAPAQAAATTFGFGAVASHPAIAAEHHDHGHGRARWPLALALVMVAVVGAGLLVKPKEVVERLPADDDPRFAIGDEHHPGAGDLVVVGRHRVAVGAGDGGADDVADGEVAW
jgi:SpoIID/LytB domain protein